MKVPIKRLFRSAMGVPEKPLSQRCLELTAFYETSQRPPDCYGRVGGNFDAQVLSVGALQWNLGQQTLQPMLRALVDTAPDAVRKTMGPERMKAMVEAMDQPLPVQLRWGHSIQDRQRVKPEWVRIFADLGKIEEWQQIQVDAARKFYDWALEQCSLYDLHSERSVALFFDIRVQNGSISSRVRAEILKSFNNTPRMNPNINPEVWRMSVIAILRAGDSNPLWIEDVKTRKLAIAGGGGSVHGHSVDLEKDFDVTLRPSAQAALRHRQAQAYTSGAIT